MSNQVYNNLMTRNHFSKAGGPYFINDGFSGHSENQKPKDPDKGFVLFVSIGLLAILVTVSLILTLAL